MVDLTRVAQQIRLDLLAVHASRVLDAADIPHALIKGPTTARWLYDPPRDYRDVDLLVPRSRAADAVRALHAADVAHPTAGSLGEEASHSQLLLSPTGIELDLHVTLPSLPLPPANDPDRLWTALADHLVPFDIDATDIPALDTPARYLVLALHALASPDSEQVREDLRRASERLTPEERTRAESLANNLGLARHLQGALTLIGRGAVPALLPADVRLRLAGASSSAIQLERLSREPLRTLPGALWREAFPSPGFMRRANPGLPKTRRGLARAYARRLSGIARGLPRAVAEWRNAH